MGYYIEERGGEDICASSLLERKWLGLAGSLVCEPKVHTRPSAEREINKKMASSFFFFCFLSFLEDIRNGFFNFWGLWKIIGNRKKRNFDGLEEEEEEEGRGHCRTRSASSDSTEKKEKTWPQNSVKKGEKSNDTNPKEEEYYYYMAHCVCVCTGEFNHLTRCTEKNVKTSGLKKEKKKKTDDRTDFILDLCVCVRFPSMYRVFSFFKEIIMIPEAEIFMWEECCVYPLWWAPANETCARADSANGNIEETAVSEEKRAASSSSSF